MVSDPVDKGGPMNLFKTSTEMPRSKSILYPRQPFQTQNHVSPDREHLGKNGPRINAQAAIEIPANKPAKIQNSAGVVAALLRRNSPLLHNLHAIWQKRAQ